VISVLRSIIKNQRGQAMVEMALILPVLILMIFGTVEFGRIYASYLMVNNAAREGARFAAVGATDAQITTLIMQRSSALDETQMTVTITPPDGSRVRAQGVQVDVVYPVRVYAPVISNIIGDPYLVSAQVIMRVE